MEVPDSEERLRWSLSRFLSAAAKKYSPARIVIIIDGVNNLKGEDTPKGTLHWLPSELPPCVRFILSSTELEKTKKEISVDTKNLNRTYMELTRRKCPFVPMEPLSVNTRHNIINEFITKQPGKLVLLENNQFKIVTAPASAQPLYLRSLLQALRLSVTLTNISVEHLLEGFLKCASAREIIHKMLNICFNALVEIASDGAHKEILGKMLSVVYVSREGLSEDEVWNLLRLVSGIEINSGMKSKLIAILKDICMVVNNLYSFSHEIYREVVYEKYIKSPDALVRWHFVMARFFGQLPSVPRKLNCLPYHLEVAGSWSKVKNCLTDIEMFQLWWTPPFKSDFMKFWASLTAKTPIHNSTDKNNDNHSIATESRTTSISRPTFDIVEEYVKSLDEYRTLKHPSEETVANIILKVSEFLIEFATLGHEETADVPYSIHPVIPSDDLKSIGVPHITIDKEGRSYLWYPTVFPDLGKNSSEDQKSDSGPVDDIPSRSATKAVEDIPLRTAYFFSRWMWIQFPYIALGNCFKRFDEGISMKNAIDGVMGKSLSLKSESFDKSKNFFKKSFFKEGMSLSKSTPLPEIAFVRKAARSFRRATPGSSDEFDAGNQFNQRLINLQDSIQNLKEEFDFLSQQRGTLNKQLYQLKGSLVDLKRAQESTSQFDGDLNEMAEREQKATQKYEKSCKINLNLSSLMIICERHPPHMPALILEIENKLDQDELLISEIKKRLWEQKFEHNTHLVKFKEMKSLVKEGVSMHEQLLEYRLDMKKRMQKQGIEDAALLASNSNKFDASSQSVRTMSEKKMILSKSRSHDDSDDSRMDLIQKSWADKWSVIASRTGINDPNIFFKRIQNRFTNM